MENYEIRPVRNAIVMLTNQCNCRCVYCFEQRKPGRMSLDTAKDTLRFLHRSGSPNVGFTFFGGEPMLEFDSVIVPLVEWSKTAFEYKTKCGYPFSSAEQRYQQQGPGVPADEGQSHGD